MTKTRTRGAAIVAMLMALSMFGAPAMAEHGDTADDGSRFPALARSDCDAHGGTFTRDRNVEVGDDGWVGDVRTCVVVSQDTDTVELDIGRSPRTFDSTLTYRVTDTYVQVGDRNNNPDGVSGFQRTTSNSSELLSCTDPGNGDGVWLPGENNCPTS